MATQIRKYRKSSDYSYTLGVFPTIELLNCQREDVLKVLISSKGENNSGVSEITEICRDGNVQFEVNDR